MGTNDDERDGARLELLVTLWVGFGLVVLQAFLVWIIAVYFGGVAMPVAVGLAAFSMAAALWPRGESNDGAE